MDIFAHSLWTGLVFNKQKKRNFAWSIFFGIAPDLFSFGIYLVASFLLSGQLPFSNSTDHLSTIVPQYLGTLYDITHSFVIFTVVFLTVWFLRKKPFWPLLAWGIHIALDVPLHSGQFFPTPFLFPLSNFKISSVSWGNFYAIIVNYSLLAILYLGLYLKHNKKKKLSAYLKEQRKIKKI